MCVYNRETAFVKQDYISMENSGLCSKQEVTAESPSSEHTKREEVLWIIVLFMVIITEFLLELFLLANSTVHLHYLLSQSFNI